MRHFNFHLWMWHLWILSFYKNKFFACEMRFFHSVEAGDIVIIIWNGNLENVGFLAKFRSVAWWIIYCLTILRLPEDALTTFIPVLASRRLSLCKVRCYKATVDSWYLEKEKLIGNIPFWYYRNAALCG